MRSLIVRRELIILLAAGLLSGLLVLGIGGRMVMRLAAFTTPEAPRFSWPGTLQIAGSGAVWGLVTAPLLLIFRAMGLSRRVRGALFGLAVLALAIPPFLTFSGFTGTLVAPASFFWLGAIAFPILFALHGIFVEGLTFRSPASPGSGHPRTGDSSAVGPPAAKESPAVIAPEGRNLGDTSV